jgi:hypothetical protein
LSQIPFCRSPSTGSWTYSSFVFTAGDAAGVFTAGNAAGGSRKIAAATAELATAKGIRRR